MVIRKQCAAPASRLGVLYKLLPMLFLHCLKFLTIHKVSGLHPHDNADASEVVYKEGSHME